MIQRENDWYALGYTIWTLYNDGIHPHQALIDAGDLSAVLAGKHPVEFIPHHPEEATLGELIYGLTLESVRGRLGYDDVQAWLEDPAHFHFEDPFDRAESGVSYQFKGKTYTVTRFLLTQWLPRGKMRRTTCTLKRSNAILRMQVSMILRSLASRYRKRRICERLWERSRSGAFNRTHLAEGLCDAVLLVWTLVRSRKSCRPAIRAYFRDASEILCNLCRCRCRKRSVSVSARCFCGRGRTG